MVTYTRTRNDFEHSLLRLTAEQQNAVDRIHAEKDGKDYVVTGSAGTGKSLVVPRNAIIPFDKVVTNEKKYFKKALMVRPFHCIRMDVVLVYICWNGLQAVSR